jgi:hypothetical protein
MRIEIFNETMIMLASSTLFGFTDFSIGSVVTPEAKYRFGWYLCGIMLFTVAVNILIALWE